jgi:hypothetical protein
MQLVLVLPDIQRVVLHAGLPPPRVGRIRLRHRDACASHATQGLDELFQVRALRKCGGHRPGERCLSSQGPPG